MDEIQEYEIATIFDYIQYADRNIWESARLQMYILAQVNSKKKLKPGDILHLAWDDDHKEKPLSHEELTALDNKSREIAARLFNKEQNDGSE